MHASCTRYLLGNQIGILVHKKEVLAELWRGGAGQGAGCYTTVHSQLEMMAVTCTKATIT
jgi:hypothetical protein